MQIMPLSLYGEGYKRLRYLAQAIFTALYNKKFDTTPIALSMIEKGVERTPCWNHAELFDYPHLRPPGPKSTQHDIDEYNFYKKNRDANAEQARMLCERCPLQVECLAYAMNTGGSHPSPRNPLALSHDMNMIYGGYTPTARKKLFDQVLDFTRQYSETGRTRFVEGHPLS